MTVHHHIDESTLLRYASGDLDEAFSVIVAAHLAMCEDCRKALRLANDIGGSLLDREEPAPLADNALERIMSGIDTAGARIEQRTADRDADADVPVPLRRFIGNRLDEISWKRVAPGVRRHMIEIDAPSSLYLLHIGPGKAVPEHGHGGAEMTLILSGAYRDQLGRFGPGDIADLDEHIEHQPRVEPGAPCICVVATEEPTRFKGVFSRLLQPIVGI
ncbi:ChrR family anti-sigma-E factor [Breoghania sp.]|uniref:ChrR family anti-sigma-E factor n=1 Tax=Breoghania sp. TaxID=2065378 RepID=UPI0029CA4F67|nr:ChrR family anti-sigma-E factor [Breoghania sp.]